MAWWLRLAWLVLLLGGFAQPAWALDETVLKTALLRNIVEFVRWPVQPETLTLCTLGQDELGSAADALAGYRVQKSALALRRHLRGNVIANVINGCHVLYVSQTERAQLAPVLDAARERPLLIVADIEGAAQWGVTLSFYEAGGRLGFDANFAAAQSAGLRLDARLLQLARRVY